ncbi:GLPGLI family protein [Myroides sp. LJL110]
MKKIISLCFLLFTFSIWAQDKQDSLTNVTRYIYQSKVLTDKTQPDKFSHGVAVLDISEKGSVFADKDHIKRKQGIKAVSKKNFSQENHRENLMGLIGATNPVFSWHVVNTQDINQLYVTLDFKNYCLTQPKQELIWEIDPTLLDWHGYTVQKATTNYGGRVWYALFTAQISANSGPYLFNNLPGLVVKAYDSENHYEFELLYSETNLVDFEELTPKKYTEVNYEEFKKLQKIYYNKSFFDSLVELHPKNAEYADQHPPSNKVKRKTWGNPIDRNY